MELNEYAVKAAATADYPNKFKGLTKIEAQFNEDVKIVLSWNFMYPTTKLAGEAGEFSEKVGKIIRDQDSVVTEEDRLELAKELGDILWYVNCAALELEYSLEEIAQMNLDKLASRKERGVIHGSGDNR